MTSIHRIAAQASHSWASVARVLAISTIVVCAPPLAGPLWGQQTVWYQNGSNAWWTSGNVGVGTPTPAYAADIAGTSFFPYLRVMNTTTGSINGTGVLMQRGDQANGYSELIYYTGSTRDWSSGTRAGSNNYGISSGPNAASRLMIDTSGNVGIGTTVPTLRLEVQGSRWTPLSGYQGVAGLYSTDAQGADVGAGLLLGGAFTGTTITQFGQIAGVKESGVDGNYAGALTFSSRPSGGVLVEQMRVASTGNVGIGTTTPTYPLTVKGIIGAREVIVTATMGADYVFKPEYHLRQLNEVSAFMKEHHHLPEIPSETEVQANGVSLGDMQMKLLAKIEELTLHAIQADERNSRLEQQNRELQDRVARLETPVVKGGVRADH